MATAVFMPKLSMTMETGTVIQWFKQEGDQVREGDVLLEVLTDKINIEVESYTTGTLLKIYYGADQVVPVNQVIGYVGEANENVPDTPPPLESSASQEEEEAPDAQPSKEETQGSEALDQKIRATPVARRMARENGIDLGQVSGSGPNGRVQKADIEHALSTNSAKAASTRTESVTSLPGRQVKVEGMRKVIAERMVASAYTAPHVTLSTEADMSKVIEVRSTLLPTIEKLTGHRLSYTEIIIKAVATALSRHPKVNASLKDDVIELHETINIGVAVAVTDGLLVPVIKQADQKGLAHLTTETKRLAGLARDGRLLPDDMRGGTFTISNLGMYAIDVFTPIINQPESAILGVGRIHEKPVGVNGQIVLRPMMSLSLSFDHRVMDGAPAAAFLQEIKELLESPYHLLA
ncbi:dihydrolipoamide acetyltransferase component of pyruvate dehydrogenase complex [Brevibacillus reuszeri]|uniref:Dihydrolipoamide acetyltransferase component of pyruvate dehydrogenase complex n=1 Tax=Brevibacillus reuszeri TaxID=54915 RepID=A0A0K9Z1E9_9BACL|nr:dihydrolipoamide acetyltransferase family protein [Brevibacillus reuszeri]KNB74779.1 branched-chain alpha-keto acid dehydrogenase subunit E2 [Brevibacillus reuszeri]MED1859575.1 dihydrolipoamide acetyltransferase family protein [Brevibacillus reuszeri]GED71925.1 dihydrolipoamide acetyltransferase component of pyruvate dehydrogenase complex [Brevibacillus reuszeri]